jgi:hypothetical protein
VTKNCLVGFFSSCRYGERNLAFTVASFSGDDKEDVTSAVERVTSDYHSCSSSDEDSGLRETRPPPTFPQNRHKYQVQPVTNRGCNNFVFHTVLSEYLLGWLWQWGKYNWNWTMFYCSKVIYPATPLWRPPVPKQKMWPGKGYNGPPRPPHYDFRHNDWAPPVGHRRWHGYWGGTPGLAHC